MPDHQTRTVFHSSLLQVEEFVCDGTHHEHQDEEYAVRHEIVFPRAGVFVRHDAAGTMVADANQLLFFHSHQPYSISHPVKGGDCSTIFALDSAVLMDLLRTCDTAVDEHPDKPFRVSHMLLAPRHRLLQYQLLHRMNCHQDSFLALEEAILDFLADTVSHSYRFAGLSLPRRREQTHRFQDDLVNQVKLVLGERFRDRLTLDQIASAVNSSPYFLCRIFKQRSGLSIHQYVSRVRLCHALETIVEYPKDDFTRIALDLGFASHSHFSTAFLREFGITPSQFRLTATTRRAWEMSRILKV